MLADRDSNDTLVMSAVGYGEEGAKEGQEVNKTVHTSREVGELCLRLWTRELRLAEVVGKPFGVEIRFSLVS